MASKIKINLDTNKENYLVAKCKQNDDITLEATIYENGLSKYLDTSEITIQGLKADNTYIIQDTDISKESNVITANLNRDFTRIAGTTKIEIVLRESGKQNTTFSFYLEVVGSVINKKIESENTVTILETLTNKVVEAVQVKEETEQLIQSGGAATKGDIETVNSQLAQKAMQIDVEKANKRIDNLIVNSGEGTEKDSELIDSRVDSEGKVYSLVGELTREIDKKTKSVHSDTYEDKFYITDNYGNVIFKADKNGVEGVNLGSGSESDSGSSVYKGMKLITIGDSLSAHDGWQKWLVEWLGFNFDLNENLNGSNGFSPTAQGGTAIRPKGVDSIYMRALDVKNYIDDVNGTVIILNAGQNDWFPSSGVGTLDDVPYRERKVDPNSDYGTLCSYYMGMVENLLEDVPKAQIFLVTSMQMWTEDNRQDENRNIKRKMIKDIGEKYGIPVIDLWAKSGVNSFNGSEHYPEIGNVHPNDYGYKKMAYCIYRELGGK